MPCREAVLAFLQQSLLLKNKSGSVIDVGGYSYKCKTRANNAHYYYCETCKASVIYRNGTFRRGTILWNKDGEHVKHQPPITASGGQELRLGRQLLARSFKLVRKRRQRSYGVSSIDPGYLGSGDGQGERLLIEALLATKRDEQGDRFFLVKWMGFPKWDSSWEAGVNLPQSLVMKFDLDKEQDKSRVDKDGGSSMPHPVSILHKKGKERLPIVRKFSKNRSLFPQEYLMIKKLEGELMLLGKFRGREHLFLVPFNLARTKTPQMLIRFLEVYLKPQV